MESTNYSQKAKALISSRSRHMKKSEHLKSDIKSGNLHGESFKSGLDDASKILVLVVSSCICSNYTKTGRYTSTCLLQVEFKLVGGKTTRVLVDLAIKRKANKLITRAWLRPTSLNISLKISDLKYLKRDFAELIFREDSRHLASIRRQIIGKLYPKTYQLLLL